MRDRVLCLSCLVVLAFGAGLGRAELTVEGGLTYEREAKPGDTYQGTVVLTNIGKEPEEAKVYLRDYLFYCDGRSVYGEPGETPRSSAKWITFTPDRVVVPPGGKTTVQYTVVVPESPGLAGTYWCIMMVEGVPAASPEAAGQPDQRVKFGIQQVFRYGLQLISHIQDTGTKSLKFLNVKLLRDGEQRFLQIDVENTGERWLRPAVSVELFDETGAAAGKIDAGRLRVFPGTSVRFRPELSPVKEGTYKALIAADCGGDDLFGAEYTLKLER